MFCTYCQNNAVCKFNFQFNMDVEFMLCIFISNVCFCNFFLSELVQ